LSIVPDGLFYEDKLRGAAFSMSKILKNILANADGGVFILRKLQA